MTDQESKAPEELQALLDEIYSKAMQKEAERKKIIAEQAESQKRREETAEKAGTEFKFDPEKNLELIRAVMEEFWVSDRVSRSLVQQRFALGYRTIAAVMDYLQEKKYIKEDVDGELKISVPYYVIEEICPDEDD